MCGIAGILNPKGNPYELIRKMTGTLVHRGPDMEGYEYIERDNVVLGHRRLAILDLSDNGSQPMTSGNGRYTVVLNGEIYNYQELKQELEAAGIKDYRSTCDTEILVEYFSAFGIEKTLGRINGMYAIGLYDRECRQLTLARDRGGEKPLYFGRIGDSLYFSSELKAIRSVAGDFLALDEEAVRLYLKHSYIPQPLSIYKNIYKLKQGCYITFSYPDWRAGIMKTYWSYGKQKAEYRNISYEDARRELKRLLKTAIKRQMITDVPYGAFLSGGIDSSLIVSVMQEMSPSPVNTFTIGFDDKAFNEADYAKKTADYLGCKHTERKFTSQELVNIVPNMAKCYDEPFADVSQLPMYLLSGVAKEKVTVCLSGDAGDELFAGYEYYSKIPKLISQYPKGMTQIAGGLLGGLRVLDRRFREKGKRIQNLHKNSMWDNLDGSCYIDRFCNTETESTEICEWYDVFLANKDILLRMEGIDFYHELSDKILVKVDRATMAHSLEARVPMLDKDIIEFSTSIPNEYKICDGKQKRILRDILAEYLPRSLFERPKQGFGVPIHTFLRNDLREWADSIFYGSELRRFTFIDQRKMISEWEFWKTKSYRSRMLEFWRLCMLGQWMREQNSI